MQHISPLKNVQCDFRVNLPKFNFLLDQAKKRKVLRLSNILELTTSRFVLFESREVYTTDFSSLRGQTVYFAKCTQIRKHAENIFSAKSATVLVFFDLI